MADLKRCDGPECKNVFQPQRSTARFCSATCRQRASRDRKAAEREAAAPTPDPDTGKSEHSLLRAVRKELTASGALETVDGQLALQVARRIVEPDGSGLAALTKELRSLLASAKAAGTSTPPPDGNDPQPAKDAEGAALDEIKDRRDAKARAAASRA